MLEVGPQQGNTDPDAAHVFLHWQDISYFVTHLLCIAASLSTIV